MIHKPITGDHNPIHVDVKLAKSKGYKTPIMHGNCLTGIYTRIIYENLLNYD